MGRRGRRSCMARAQVAGAAHAGRRAGGLLYARACGLIKAQSRSDSTSMSACSPSGERHDRPRRLGLCRISCCSGRGASKHSLRPVRPFAVASAAGGGSNLRSRRGATRRRLDAPWRTAQPAPETVVRGTRSSPSWFGPTRWARRLDGWKRASAGLLTAQTRVVEKSSRVEPLRQLYRCVLLRAAATSARCHDEIIAGTR